MLNDEQLALAAQNGDIRSLETLLERYKNLVRAKASIHILSGLDREDLIQEGMIGLFKATRNFEQDKGASFKTFAELCVDRQVITAVRSSRRQKHTPLNFYVSLDRPVDDAMSSGGRGKRRILAETLADVEVLNPLSVVIGQEESEKALACFSKMLSRLETQIVELKMAGNSYKEIASKLGVSRKSVDNALQRVKFKFAKCYPE